MYSSFQVQIVESLFRIVVVLGKIKKDRERIRLFICDALYCLQFRAVNILFIALTSWPEIIPQYDPNGSNGEFPPRIVLFLKMFSQFIITIIIFQIF